jgi:hypothetical protein
MRKQENTICFEPDNIQVSALPMHGNQQTIKNVLTWFDTFNMDTSFFSIVKLIQHCLCKFYSSFFNMDTFSTAYLNFIQTTELDSIQETHSTWIQAFSPL